MFKHKKIVSILVLAAMLLALLPTAGFAETLDTADENPTETVIGGGSETPLDADPILDGNNDNTAGTEKNDSPDAGGNTDDPSTTLTPDPNANDQDSNDGKEGDIITGAGKGEPQEEKTEQNEENVNKDEGLALKDGPLEPVVFQLRAPLNASPDYKNTLTIYHILTSDGRPLANPTDFAANENYLYSYKVELRNAYKPNHIFDIPQLTNGTPNNRWTFYWTAPQDNWKLKSYFPETLSMPAGNGSTSINLYYSLSADGEVHYSTPTGSPLNIMIDGLKAFCLNQEFTNPANYGSPIPYKAPIPFSEAPDAYTSKISEALLYNILLVSYPCDALGLFDHYQKQYPALNSAAAASITQEIIWCLLNTDSGSAETLIKKIDLYSLCPDYVDALYTKAVELTASSNGKANITYEPLTVTDGSASLAALNFIEQEDGTFATKPVTILGYHDQYQADVALALPNTMAIYDNDGHILDPAQLPLNTPLVFTSTVDPSSAHIDAIAAEDHNYALPHNLWFYESYLTGYKDGADNGIVSNTKAFQNLLAYDFIEDTVTTSFPITVTIKSTPLEPAEPTPVDPDNNGGGGGGGEDYTPDTPDTPDTPNIPDTPYEPSTPAETLIPDEDTPLAPAPELVPETEAEVTLDEEPVPLAPAAPVSDNPKTGHAVNVIFILQACLLLAAAALLLHDLRQYKKAQ